MQRREEDRISGLPDSVREDILMFLPLKEAAKASILSTKWRSLWTNLPTLVFDEEFGSEDKDAVNKLMYHLCRVVMLHRGPLRDVSLKLPVLKSFPDHLDQILLILQDRCIERLTVMQEGYIPSRYLVELIEDYKLSRRLFSRSFSQLKALHLSLCRFTSPTNSFEGFTALTVLELRSVEFTDDSEWRLRCPLLSSLTLDRCGYVGCMPDIVIEAPKLVCFHFFGSFGSLHLKHTPILRKTVIRNRPPFFGYKKDKSRLRKLWGGLVAVESLSVSDHFYHYLATGNEPEIDLSSLEMLRHVALGAVCLSRRSDSMSVLLMIVQSPNLQRLSIAMKDISKCSKSSRYGGAIDIAELHTILEGLNVSSEFEQETILGRFKRVEVKSLKGTKLHEMAFIRWLLNSSPALDVMEIKLSPAVSADEKILLLTELVGFPRASTSSRITVS